MGLGIPPLRIKIKLESNPLKSTMLVGRLGVRTCQDALAVFRPVRASQQVEGCVYIYIYIYIYNICVCIYIYIERERERHLSLSISLSLYIYIYIYTYVYAGEHPSMSLQATSHLFPRCAVFCVAENPNCHPHPHDRAPCMKYHQGSVRPI